MASNGTDLMDYFKKSKSSVSISYEFPTDVLKIPKLLAEANNEIYIKEKKIS
jgi:hypothetical protein